MQSISMKINRLIKIISTNWVHLVGFYVTTYLSLILFKLFGLDTSDSWVAVLLISILTIPLLFFVYGVKIVGGFYFALLLLDIIAFSSIRKRRIEILIVEWWIISIPFIYWAFKYQYWLWITLSISFLVTQMIRLQRIKKIEARVK
jgi:hypothetical protein